MAHVQRNAPCPCGSGEKFKHCCMGAAAANRTNLSPVLRWQLPLLATLFGGLVLLVLMTNG